MTFDAEERRWVRDHTGFRGTTSVTLADEKLTALRFPDGLVPWGTVLAAIDGQPGLVGPYEPAATDGRQKAEPGRVETSYLPTSSIRGAVGLLDDNVRAAVSGEFCCLTNHPSMSTASHQHPAAGARWWYVDEGFEIPQESDA